MERAARQNKTNLQADKAFRPKNDTTAHTPTQTLTHMPKNKKKEEAQRFKNNTTQKHDEAQITGRNRDTEYVERGDEMERGTSPPEGERKRKRERNDGSGGKGGHDGRERMVYMPKKP